MDMLETEREKRLRNIGHFAMLGSAVKIRTIAVIRAMVRVAFNLDSHHSRKFFAELGPRPPSMTLDRINNDAHYERGNVRWISRAENNRNH